MILQHLDRVEGLGGSLLIIHLGGRAGFLPILILDVVKIFVVMIRENVGLFQCWL